MKKLFICIILCFSMLTSCSTIQQTHTDNDTEATNTVTNTVNDAEDTDITNSTDADTYNDTEIDTTQSVYLVEHSDKNIISIKLPVFNDPSLDTLITDYIRGYLTETISKEFDLTRSEVKIEADVSESEYSEYFINTDYNITYSSDKLISITFDGLLNYKTAAHPIRLFFTLNFDRETKQRVLFKDCFSVNLELYELFCQHAQNNIIEKAGEWPANWGSFSESFCSFEQFELGMNQENAFFTYYTAYGIGISYQVPHALGDHFEVEIPYSEMEEFEIQATVSVFE